MAHPQAAAALGPGLDATLAPGAFDWSLAPELVIPLAAVTGLYAVLTGADTTKFNNALNTAFDQSPYLDTH